MNKRTQSLARIAWMAAGMALAGTPAGSVFGASSPAAWIRVTPASPEDLAAAQADEPDSLTLTDRSL